MGIPTRVSGSREEDEWTFSGPGSRTMRRIQEGPQIFKAGIETFGRACCATLLLGALLAPQVSKADKPDKFEIVTLSTRPDTVSGGDVLVEVRLPRNVRLRDLEVTLNRREITGAFRFDRDAPVDRTGERAEARQQRPARKRRGETRARRTPYRGEA